ncbi:MAG: hypothetical protein Fur0041_09260 [Bacteroidia bacterium]
MRYLYFCILALALVSCSESRQHLPFVWNPKPATARVAQFVNPMIGTGGHGHTYPGASAPFGMVQLSPDTRDDGSWDGCSGYHYNDSVILGFSHTHLSGTGCSDYGDVLVMPGHGEHSQMLDLSRNNYKSTFSHKKEKATAGYYSVVLNNTGTKAEFTASPRVGMHKYTFTSPDRNWIVVDLVHRDEVITADLEIVNDHTIRGHRRSKAWATDQIIWFYAEFSQPFSKKKINKEGDKIKALFEFDLTKEPVMMKVALSPVSAENAKLNMETEVPDWNFDALLKKNNDDWNNELGKIDIQTADNNKKTIFYTALYHCFLAPNVFCDVNGDYFGMDRKVYRDTMHQRYSVFSLWDTYRGLHPLFTLVQQHRTNDFINTFLRQYKESGRLPVWELSSNETDCMIGYHSVPVISDAYLKGIKNYDTLLALEAMMSSAMQDRSGLQGYRSCGFIPAEGESESVSKTLEYAFDDWCIAQVAYRMNQQEKGNTFFLRSQAWKNLHDPATHFHRARMNNSFVEPFRADEVNFHYTEANAWQYSMAVQHDIPGLVAMHGGEKAFEQFLDSLFTVSSATTGRDQADITGLIGQYAHGNEPSHHMAYLYNYCGRPDKTQKIITRICRELYTNAPNGLSGNEDCGQMSAWYVLSFSGIYPVNPCGGIFDFGKMQCDKVTYHLENGETLTFQQTDVTANNPEVPWTTFERIMEGGIINIPVYKENREGYRYDRLKIFATGPLKLAAPVIKGPVSRTFNGQMKIELSSFQQGADIWYQLNEETAQKYSSPVIIKENTTIKTWATVNVASSYIAPSSDTVSASFYKSPGWRMMRIVYPYAPQYAAGGDQALIDGLKGTENFRTGLWQGYEGEDLDVWIDLGRTMEIDSVNISFLQDENSWIFLPGNLILDITDQPYVEKEVIIANAPRQMPDHNILQVQKRSISQKRSGRYIHLKAESIKTCPKTHPGAGNKAWLFADEIEIIAH